MFKTFFSKLFFLSFSLFSVSSSNVYVALNQQHTDVLLDAFHNVSNPDSPQYGQYWEQERINQLVTPSQDAVDDLIIYFKLFDIHCVQKGGDALECDGLNLLCLKNIPKIIDFIEITDSQYQDITTSNAHSVGDGDGYVAREVLLELYNVTHNEVVNSSTSVCAVEYQNMGGISNSDLEMQQILNGQSKKDITNIVGINQSPMMEAQLDVQMMSQVAGNADIWMWSGDKWLYSFAVNFLNRTTVLMYYQ